MKSVAHYIRRERHPHGRVNMIMLVLVQEEGQHSNETMVLSIKDDGECHGVIRYVLDLLSRSLFA